MTAWMLLGTAIITEVVGSLSLRAASTGRRRWYTAVVAAYVVSLGLFAFSLRHGMNLGMAYGIWAAAGVALTAVASRLLFSEPLTRKMIGGITLIMLGVLLVELGASH